MRTQSRLTSVERITDAAVKLMEPLSVKKLYKVAIDEAVNLVNAQWGSIFLTQGRSRKLYRAYSNVPVSYQFEPRADGRTHEAYLTGKPIYIPQRELFKTHPEAAKKGIYSVKLIPLRFKNKSLGVIALQSTSKTISIVDRRNLRLFGSLVTLAIRNLEQYKQKKEMLDIQEKFMSLASHEIRNPLSVIKSYAQLAETKLNKGKPVEEKWINSITTNVERIEAMIQELLTFNQIQANGLTLHFEKCNIQAITQQVVTDFSLVFPHKIELVDNLSAAKVRIVGDTEKLSWVVMNILTNAAKYSSETSTIYVGLNLGTDNTVKITVRDEGVGIPKSELKKIFKQFYQGTNRKSGLGLGLYICKEIVEAHDGWIKLNSHVNQGTLVTIFLPQA